MKTYHDPAGRKLIGEQAVQWLCDLRQNDGSDHDAFFLWLRQSPQHVEEFLAASSLWQELDGVRPRDDAGVEAAVVQALASEEMKNVVTLRTQDTGSTALVVPKMNRAKRLRLAAASIALMVAGAAGWWLVDSQSIYDTDIGEQRTVRLGDGSILYLNTDSRARIRFSDQARDVQLLEGEALFVVARDAVRPFRVTVGTATIQALGTQFNVRRRDEGVTVAVVEGAVSLSSGTPAQTLGAGEEASIGTRGEIIKHRTPEVSAAVAWRERRLVFRGATLEEVAAEFNRYTQRPIHIEDGVARSKRLAGTFNADDPDSLMLFLKKYPDLTIENTADGFTVRGN